ncbi:alpha/beta fold hydrolase [Nocardioides zeicaulis]|uniref:Alpha/beta fold hydrolase n=1 Tax=Nocardioides zeicaulis TaxID=1776857 RepID=A0ABV6DWT1_9ACTN
MTGSQPRLTASVSVGGREFAVRNIGAGPATVILVAGYGQSMSQAWSSVHQRLGESVRTCAYDRLGVGDSDPPSGTRTFVELAEELDGVITALGVARPIVLVAHSMGAPVAMTWAAQRPADVSAVVLLDGSGPAFHEAIGVAVANALGDGSEDPDVMAVKAFLDDFEDPQTNIERVDVVASYAALDPFPRIGTVPLVVMHGTVTEFPSVMEPERLHAVWLAGQRAWASMSERGRIVEVEGAGHQIALERPDVVVQTVLSLIQSADAAV